MMLQRSKQHQTPSFQHHHSKRHQRHPSQELDNAGHQRRNNLLSLMPLLLVILLSLAQCPPTTAFVVPNEVPSILSLVYSNIPPIKKGTDSRLGFGFKLGEQADFQILIELGPQKETRPIGNQDKSDGSSFNKRQTNKTQQRAVVREVAKTEKPPSTWLEKWSNHANTSAKKKAVAKDKPSKKPVLHKPDLIQITPPEMPNQAMQQLQMLYKMATKTEDDKSRAATREHTTLSPIKLSDTAALLYKMATTEESVKSVAAIREHKTVASIPLTNTSALLNKVATTTTTEESVKYVADTRDHTTVASIHLIEPSATTTTTEESVKTVAATREHTTAAPIPLTDTLALLNKMATTEESVKSVAATREHTTVAPTPLTDTSALLNKMATTTTTTEESFKSVAATRDHTTVAPIPLTDKAASRLQERLKLLQTAINVEDLQALMQKTQDQRKAEITKELMDVSLDE